MALNQEQQTALAVLQSGKNVFLTGRAGTGKSFLIDRFIAQSRAVGKNVIVTAFTGLAAQNINGATLHSTFGLPVTPLLYRPHYDNVPDILHWADILIIDEISICRIDLFEFVMNSVILACRKWQRSIQVVVIGDFFQLPPIITDKELPDMEAYYEGSIGKGFAFQSHLWYDMEFKFVELHEIMRQADSDFIHALNQIRNGDPSGRAWIKAHCSRCIFKDAYSIVPTRKEASLINKKKLGQLDENTERTYTMMLNGSVHPNDIIADKKLVLRKGATVMILVNDTSGKHRYVNGTYGIVTELFEDHIIVELQNGEKITLEPYSWLSYSYKQSKWDTDVYKHSGSKYRYETTVVGWHTQIPVKLAWAITIHKSQGQTYDRINMDLSRTWESGHVYTALSRITSVDGLYIHGIINPNSVNVDPDVKAFYSNPYGYKTKVNGPLNSTFEE